MPGADKKPKTLYDKVLDHHIVNEQEDGTLLIYIGTLTRTYHNCLGANRSQTDISSTR
jgi:homoaconitase/3-isopropylmalate dehydratase large subunit